MAERYTKLFISKENLYAADVPVLICAGALTKDNQTGKLFAQLRMQNIDSACRKIIALKVSISTFDPAGTVLGTPKEYQYLDLNIDRGAEFGGNQPIYLEHPSARSFEAAVLEVVFSEGSPWIGTKQEWTSLGKQKTLKEALGNELAAQYCRDTFPEAKYELFAGNGVWMCACGSLNTIGEHTCYHCHHEKTALLKALDHTTLAQHLHIHKEELKVQDKKEASAKKKRTTVAMLALLLFVLFFGVKSYLAYREAEALRLEEERIAAQLEEDKRALEELLCSDAWVKVRDGQIYAYLSPKESGGGYFCAYNSEGEPVNWGTFDWAVVDGETFEITCPKYFVGSQPKTMKMYENNGIYSFGGEFIRERDVK